MKTRICVLAVVALAVWGLKRHYAVARADDLWWILSPTAHLVAVVTGTSFAEVPSEGFVSHERLFVIEKSCAGINFLVAAFGMLAFALLHRVRSSTSAVCVVGVSLLAGYVAAVLVNAGRITIAMWLSDGVFLPAATAAQIHRLEGITVYFAGLLILYELAQRVEQRLLPCRSGS
jgi:exosortase K